MVWTPIPDAVVDWVGNIMSGSVAETVWKAFVLVALLGLVYFLANFGVAGVVASFAILTTLITDRVQAIVTDIWNRNFWEA